MRALGTRGRERRTGNHTFFWPVWTAKSPSETVPRVWALEGLLILPQRGPFPQIARAARPVRVSAPARLAGKRQEK